VFQNLLNSYHLHVSTWVRVPLTAALLLYERNWCFDIIGLKKCLSFVFCPHVPVKKLTVKLSVRLAFVYILFASTSDAKPDMKIIFSTLFIVPATAECKSRQDAQRSTAAYRDTALSADFMQHGLQAFTQPSDVLFVEKKTISTQILWSLLSTWSQKEMRNWGSIVRSSFK